MVTAVTERFARYNAYLESVIELEIGDDAVYALSFPEDGSTAASEEHPLLDRIEDYLSGAVEDDFRDVSIHLDGDEHERAVLKTVRTVPYGEGVSVTDLAREIPSMTAENVTDEDRIREILATNPIPVIIPDHRVRDGPSAAPPRVEQRLRSLELIAG